MKKELLQAYEHLLVIRGTHYGLLAEEELRLVCQRYGLDEDDEGRLREMLAIPPADDRLRSAVGSGRPAASGA